MQHVPSGRGRKPSHVSVLFGMYKATWWPFNAWIFLSCSFCTYDVKSILLEITATSHSFAVKTKKRSRKAAEETRMFKYNHLHQGSCSSLRSRMCSWIISHKWLGLLVVAQVEKQDISLPQRSHNRGSLAWVMEEVKMYEQRVPFGFSKIYKSTNFLWLEQSSPWTEEELKHTKAGCSSFCSM